MLSNSNIIPEKLPIFLAIFFYGIIVKKKAFAERGVAEKSICF